MSKANQREVSDGTAGRIPPVRPSFPNGATCHGPLNAVIVGGGRACLNLLKLLTPERLSSLNMLILGVCDPNPEAPGLQYARFLKLRILKELEEGLALDGLDLIIELTGSPEVLMKIHAGIPPGTALLDHKAARLIWDLIRTGAERMDGKGAAGVPQDREQNQLQAILDSLPYRIMVVGLDKRIHAVNRTFLKEFGYRPEDILGKPCYDVRYGLPRPCGQEGRQCYLEERIDIIKEKGFFSTYEEFVDQKGNINFDVVTVAPIYDEEGELVQILEASRDVTERVALSHEVQKSKEFFEKVIESSVDGIVVVDTKGNVLIFNEGMERLTGYPAREMITKGHLSQFYSIERARENMKKMRSDVHGPPGKLNPISMNVSARDGKEIPVTLSASIISIDSKEIGSVGIFTDMREVLEMRKELEEANLQLVQSQKIAAVGRMAAGVAHEINNPLSAILIYTELLREALGDSPQHVKDLQEIVDQTMRCKRIVSDLLEFSRKPAGRATTFSLSQTVEKCLSLLTNKAGFQDIHVTTEIEPGMPQMSGDMGQIQQVLTNLMLNARDAMKGKGALHIAARFDREQSRFIIMLADTGPGIPDHLRDKVFDIFFTSKSVGEGTGLGLSISQNIVKLHGGRIFFECPADGGTIFFVELPRDYTSLPEENTVFIGWDGT